MNKFRLTINALAVLVFTLTFASLAQAQATRTWVSGVGDDANPCSRTAPCKTFAGAISKTAKDGEISVLDPGGFGAVTITKSITINGTHGAGFGGILSAGTTGIIINITDPADVRKTVRIVSLNINGASTGIDGIRINSAIAVHIEDTIIDGVTNRGINDISSISNKLYVTDCTVRNTVQSGIVVLPGASATITAMIDHTRVEQSTSNSGIAFDSSAAGSAVKGSVRDSFLVGHAANGFFTAGNGTEATVQNCLISHNATGISASGGGSPVIRLSDSTITNNTTSISNPNQVSSTGTNTITGNGANNLPNGPSITQS